MPAQKSKTRSALTFVELMILLAIIGMLFAMALPSILHAQEASRRDKCAERMKAIGLALLNYADIRGSLPPISINIDATPDIPGDATQPPGPVQAPGSAPTSTAGYSWMVLILPQIEQPELYQSIAHTSSKFTIPAFSPLVRGIYDGRTPQAESPPACVISLEAFQCPDFTGGTNVDLSPRAVGVPDGAIETGSAPQKYVDFVAANGPKGIALTNYNAMLGTHIDNVGPAVAPYPLKSASLPNSNNGAMMFRGRAFDAGTRLPAITDGTSKTIMVAETRERRFGSWYDGTMNWVVAARHSNPAAGTTAITAANNTTSVNVAEGAVTGRWTIGTDGTSATGGLALNYGPAAENSTAVYLPTAALADPDISGITPGRLWGASSEHKGGLVNHVMADAAVHAISDRIDSNVYLWLVTRNGGGSLPGF
jgi:type II secretory pathway pseudopilin PulG